MAVTALLCLLLALPLCGCRPPAPAAVPGRAGAPAGQARFADRAATAGLGYRWSIPGPRPLTILDTIGDGCAFLDYDGDGDLDALLVGTDHLALYKGDGHGHFTDVTHAAGLDTLRGHFLGVAVGDYDNDGFDDLYVSGYRTGLLLHNEPDGRGGRRFRDVTREAGMRPQPWGTCCAWGDMDGSGRLSLYVGNYVHFGDDTPYLCPQAGGILSACPPSYYSPLRGVLYRNLGGGRFVNATRAWGADGAAGKALGCAWADFDGSGRQSLYVANDSVPCDLFKNVGGRFEDVGASSGSAYDGAGNTQGGMGVDWGDYDNDGRLDLFVANYENEAKSVYRNLGHDVFEDQSQRLGIGSITSQVAFGAKWLDARNSGWLDLMIVNGHIADNVAAYETGRTYRQASLLFQNAQGQQLIDVTKMAGSDLQRPLLGRGLAVGDYDNDGRVDALVVDAEGAPLLLHNETADAGHWLELRLAGTKSNRDGYGAQVTARAGGLTQTRLCHADGSYLSSSDKRVHLGLGAAMRADLTVRWTNGHADRFLSVTADRIITIKEGDPRPQKTRKVTQ